MHEAKIDFTINEVRNSCSREFGINPSIISIDARTLSEYLMAISEKHEFPNHFTIYVDDIHLPSNLLTVQFYSVVTNDPGDKYSKVDFLRHVTKFSNIIRNMDADNKSIGNIPPKKKI